ncbi:MAG: DNA-3-methyladenine glycosylase I [SAR324 cluster bacterium]|uniref:DNA-3-methyladenine glycosylase I n=1 Tax=SAR324 cluster bacterium TaxID=2024889 RepID=A0A7X9FRC8_9DELT|nr:DNA-3-methyladenine glycosylase I [SAR324 cluster bacterium]
MPDKVTRCWWCGDNPLYIAYHDKEWGVPLHDDQKLFEMLILEGFQDGLSWLTILKKRENFRKAFRNFDPKKVARFNSNDITRLMKDEGIIRNRLKIESAISNAKAFLAVQKEFGSFDKFIWQFSNFKTIRVSKGPTRMTLRSTSPESDAMSKALKKRGFRFVGSTICYAHMQATGMVDDHVVGCFRYKDRR